MSKINLSYNIVNYTPASASPVDANFDVIEQYINQELIERDGSVAMRAQLKLVGDPISDLDAAPKQYVDQVLPIGIVMMYGGAGAPPGGKWAVCNGAELQTSQYADLYGVIGHNFSPSGTPGSRFNLPNLQDRMPMGKGTKTSMGETGGRRDTVLPKHNHGMKQHTHGMGNHTHPIDHDHPNSQTGDAGAHNHGFTDGNFFLRAAGSGDVTGGGGQKASVEWKAAADHHHSVNIAPQNNKNSGKPSDNTTGGPNDNVTGDAGQDPGDDNLPPFLGIQYIIRVR